MTDRHTGPMQYVIREAILREQLDSSTWMTISPDEALKIRESYQTSETLIWELTERLKSYEKTNN